MSAILYALLLLAALALLGNGLLFWVWRAQLATLWREAVLRAPVVIFESDDWGVGPREQAAGLRRLRAVLGRYRDAHGHPPVMTLGLTLAAPDARMRADGSLCYARRRFDHPTQAEILHEIRAGVRERVFAPQLHGMEHFLPEIACEVATRDPVVRNWLLEGDHYSELLPDFLQSRWIDARTLPSAELPTDVIERAVMEEVAEYVRIFGHVPAVVVPPTFVWTAEVEAAWARQGIRILVNCGTRFTGRSISGAPHSDGSILRNGDHVNGLLCLVRDVHFEPIKGHRAATVVTALERHSYCFRPLLLETHRRNFTSLNPGVEEAFAAMDEAVSEMQKRFPQLRFLSTEALGEAISMREPGLLDCSLRARLCAWARRSLQLPGFERRARLSGAALALRLLSLATCRN